MPAISVVMPVYNAAAYLRQALDSILRQSFMDFEFIVVDDGSTDESIQIVSSYDDKRIIAVSADHLGLTSALNVGISRARSALIVRMDSDDVAREDRLAQQIAYMDKCEDVDILSSDARLINSEGNVIGIHRTGKVSDRRRSDALTYRKGAKPILHPSVAIRRTVMERLGGYRDFACAEDHDLWLRAVCEHRFANIDELLIDYRIHDAAVSRSKRLVQATSGILSVVCHYVKASTGVDLYLQRPDILEALRKDAQSLISSKILNPETAFRRIRSLMRERQMVASLSAFRDGYRIHGLAMLPWRTRAELAAAAAVLTAEALARLGRPDPKRA